MGGRKVADRYLFQAGVGTGHRHDQPVAGDDPAHAVTLDDLERIDGDRRIGGDGRESFLDETRSFGRRERGDSAHPEERGAVQFDRGGRDLPFARRTGCLLCAERCGTDQRSSQ